MPYIAAEVRPPYEELIKSLARTIREATEDHTKRAGHLNYVVTRLLLDTYGRELLYWQHNEIFGMLECCKQEFYRRRLLATSPE
jgi:hypothetical protein